ncbi:MAG TPA: hypothetical protein VFQ69_00120 [Rhizomicrobium sp.]|nr:hypothetical protein [Rhizomicrobium sp.]
MRVTLFTASLLLTTAMSAASLGMMTVPARADAAPASEFRRQQAALAAKRVPARVVRRSAVEGSYYDYGSARAVSQQGWHGEWRVARNEGYAYGQPPEAYYGPPPGYYEEGLRVDENGWSGGVGAFADGGDGGGGFGQLHFGNGGSVENGPTYNSYNQSFQYNPSMAGPFRPRLMGGFAPPSK